MFLKDDSPIFSIPKGIFIFSMPIFLKDESPIILTGIPWIFSGIVISLLVPKYLTTVPVFLSKSNPDGGVSENMVFFRILSTSASILSLKSSRKIRLDSSSKGSMSLSNMFDSGVLAFILELELTSSEVFVDVFIEISF